MRKSLFISTHGRSLVFGGLAAASLVVVAGAALAGSSGTYIPQLGITVPDDKAAAVEHSLPPGGAESSVRAHLPTGRPDRIPAHMLAEDVPVPIAPQVLEPRNGWLVSDGATLVAVYAGAAGDDPSKGRFVIVRQNLAAGVQTENVVDIPRAGSLALISAPSGAGVETSAQRVQLGFQSASGGTGVLDLATDHASTG